jgi:AraC family transcriptional activator of pobA
MSSQSDYLDNSTDRDVRLTVLEPVPTFYLYGEPHRSVADDFVHVESLDDRSRPADWTIQPHAHSELNHMILIAEGGGVMRIDGAVTRFGAPCLILVPSCVVHGFHWHDDSGGYVVTVANACWDELVRRDPDCASLFAAPALVPLRKDATRSISAQARLVMRELGWAAPGHRTAVLGALAAIAVHALRGLVDHATEHEPSRGRQADLVARFREMVEERFRLREPIGLYASELGVSPTTLRVACARITGKSPAEIVNRRTLLEAKRALCYTNQTVAEVAYGLGFIDPAYFSRAFSKYAGCSPRQFRTDYEGVR